MVLLTSKRLLENNIHKERIIFITDDTSKLKRSLRLQNGHCSSKKNNTISQQIFDNTDLEPDISFIKIIGTQYILNRISGYVPSKITQLLLNSNRGQTVCWLTRHGESEDNIMGKLGGDSALSLKGQCYANVLADFVKSKNAKKLVLWTSSLQRTQQTAAKIGLPAVKWKALDEIDAGICEGMTYKEIGEKYPEIAEARSLDKFGYRYPKGEVSIFNEIIYTFVVLQRYDL